MRMIFSVVVIVVLREVWLLVFQLWRRRLSRVRVRLCHMCSRIVDMLLMLFITVLGPVML